MLLIGWLVSKKFLSGNTLTGESYLWIVIISGLIIVTLLSIVLEMRVEGVVLLVLALSAVVTAEVAHSGSKLPDRSASEVQEAAW